MKKVKKVQKNWQNHPKPLSCKWFTNNNFDSKTYWYQKNVGDFVLKIYISDGLFQLFAQDRLNHDEIFIRIDDVDSEEILKVVSLLKYRHKKPVDLPF